FLTVPRAEDRIACSKEANGTPGRPEGSVYEKWRYCVIAVAIMLLVSPGAAAGLDLRNAVVERLDNGLKVILLEDRNFPVVSTQMLYRVGARDESYGHTGLAHFLEHMAFRDSEHFPDTGL